MPRDRRTVKVFDSRGIELTNCRTQKAKELINTGKAKLIRIFPQMTIQLTWEVIPEGGINTNVEPVEEG